MSDPSNHLGSIWYHSEPSDVSYSPNQFLGCDFFCPLLQQDGSDIKIVWNTNETGILSKFAFEEWGKF